MELYKITLVRSNIVFYYDNSISLLRAIEENNIQPEYACRNGFCGSCCAIVRSGKWHYRSDPIAFCRSNQILLCCCIVDSDLELEL